MNTHLAPIDAIKSHQNESKLSENYPDNPDIYNMRVRAPHWITETQNPDDHLFICFMYDLALEHGFKVAYYMHAGDLGILFKDKKNIYVGNPTLMLDTTKWIQIGKVTNNQFRVQFMTDKHQEIEWQIKGEKHRAIWTYLQGLKSNDAIFYEKSLGPLQKWRKHRLPAELRKWLNDR